MKKLIITLISVLTLNCLIIIQNSEAQWVQQYYTGSNSIALNAIQFVNDNTGFIVGEEENFNFTGGVFLKTTNGGINWVRINMNLTFDHWLYALSFINSNTGYVCGRTSYVRKTTDGGLTWASYSVSENTPNFNTIQFMNEQTGYIGGRYGMRAKSTNGGVNWIMLDTAFTHINTLHFFDVNTGFMADAHSGIYRTTNGGLNWTYKYQTDSGGASYAFYGNSFVNENTGYMIGTTYYSGLLVKTTNKGIDWSVVRTVQNEILSVYALNNLRIYVGVSSPYILFSSDGGINWSNQSVPTIGILITSIYFLNQTVGFSCAGGYIYRTTNGGVNISNISSEHPNEFMLFQNYPNPFNSETKLRFAIRKGGDVYLSIFDINGKEIKRQNFNQLQSGTYEVGLDLSNQPSGIYFCRMSINNVFKNAKLVLIK